MPRTPGRGPRWQSAPRGGRHLEIQVVIGQASRQICQQQIHDVRQVVLGQRVEDDDLVDRLRNSGRKTCRSVSVTWSFICSYEASSRLPA